MKLGQPNCYLHFDRDAKDVLMYLILSQWLMFTFSVNLTATQFWCDYILFTYDPYAGQLTLVSQPKPFNF